MKGQNMIETLAHKRTHLAALAVLAGLVVALFAVIQSASAAPALVVTIDDTDNVVKAGTSNDVRLHVTGDDGGAAYTVSFVIGSSGIVISDGATDQITPRADDSTPHAPAGSVATVVFPPNAAGEYTISARVTRGTGDDLVNLDGFLTVTVGDPGVNIASAEIKLGKAGHNAARTAGSDTATAPAHPAISTTDATTDGAPDSYTDCAVSGAANTRVTGDESLDGTTVPDVTPTTTYDAALSGCVALTLTVSNSLGEKANAAEITQIDVYAPLATVIFDATATADTNDTGVDTDGAARVADSANSVKFFIAKAAAGEVPVTAFVQGRTGFTSAQTFTLTFTGSADTISVGEADSALAQTGTAYVAPVEDDTTTADVDETVEEVESSGEARIEVTAVDKAGNVATLVPTQIGVEIFDADDELYTKIESTVTQQKNAKGADVSTALRITLRGEEADPGTYTVKVTFGDNDPVETTVVVAGKVADVALEASKTTVAIGDIITVTATVTDADGNLSPDVGDVAFQAVGALVLNALGKGANGGSVSVGIDDGTAMARFVVTNGSGTSTIIGSVSGIDGVTSVSTEAAEAAEEAVSLDCLSSPTGFSSYTCSMDSSASELFGLLSGRGATAIHLWNGSMWVRYAVVDGAEIPGSSDFTVTEDDILYISN